MLNNTEYIELLEKGNSSLKEENARLKSENEQLKSERQTFRGYLAKELRRYRTYSNYQSVGNYWTIAGIVKQLRSGGKK